MQALWFLALIPAVVVATERYGIVGAGWAHLAVSAALILPAYAVALARVGISPRILLRSLAPPVGAAIPCWVIAHAVSAGIDVPVLALLLGGLAGLAVYTALMFRWVRQLLPTRDDPREPLPHARVEQAQLEGVGVP